MADANYFKVSDGQTINIADIEARSDIDSLRESKQDTLTAGDNISISDSTISSSHPWVSITGDTISEQTIPLGGGSFYTVDSVTRDDFGHVRSINMKTVTIPAGGGGSGIDSVSYESNILTLHLSDGNDLSVSLGNAITDLSIEGTYITITYEDGSTGLLSLSADSEVTPDSNNFITSGAVYTAIETSRNDLQSEIDSKQDTLIPGDNITINSNIISAERMVYTSGDNINISEDNVISAVNTTYSAGDNIGITGTEISAVNTTYSAGSNITIDENNVINAANTTYSFDLSPTEGSSNGVTSGGVYSAIQSAASSVYEYKGACAREDLPIIGTGVGDVWNLADASEFGPAGTNVAWNGSEWQVLGGSYSAGENITISSSGVISAVNTTYSAGDNISISAENEISSLNTTYSAGSNISIEGSVINAVNTTYSAGSNISIENEIISAVDTTYSAGDNIEITEDNYINSSHPDIVMDQDTATQQNPYFGESFDAVGSIERDQNGHVIGVETTTVYLPASVLAPGRNISIEDGVISAVDTTYSAGDNVTIGEYNSINASHVPVDITDDTTTSYSPSAGTRITMVDSVTRDELGHVLTLNTKTIKLPEPTPVQIPIDPDLNPNSQNPVTNSAITQAIDNKISEPAVEGRPGQVLTTDGLGGRSWTTVGGSGPDFNTTYELTNDDGVITLTDSNGHSDIIPMDTVPTEDSVAPITSGGVYQALGGMTTYSAGDNISISAEGVISAVNTTYSAGSNITIENGVISATGTTYTFDNTPTQGSLNPVTSDGIYQAIQSSGGGGKTYTLSNESGVLTLTGSDSSASTVSMDTEPTQNSYAPITSGGVYQWVVDKLAALFGQVAKYTAERFELIAGATYGELRLKDNMSSDTFPTELDFRLMSIPRTITSMYQFLYGSSTRDPQANISYYASITKLTFGLDTSSITNMSTCFSGMTALTSIDLTGFNTSRVTTMLSMFRNCSSLLSLDLSMFDMSTVSSMRYFINGCTSLQTLNISGCNMSGCHDADQAFLGLPSLVNVITDNTTKLPSWTSVNFGDSANLTLQSGINILNALPSVSSGTYFMIFNTTVLTLLSGDTQGSAAITSAESRGWTVQGT